MPVKAFSVDASDPYNTKVNYRVEPGIVIDAATFTAPGKTETKNNLFGDFYFTYDQNHLSFGENIIQLQVNLWEKSYTINVTATKIEKRGPMAKEVAFGKIFLQEGIFTIPVNHHLFEVWYLIEYAIPIISISKTVWVGESLVNIQTQQSDALPTAIGCWDEEHYYRDNNGSYLTQAMSDVTDPTLPPQTPYFKSKDSDNNVFFVRGNGLSGYAEIKILFFDSSAGLVQWVPVPPLANTVVDKPLN